ncbi:hypothetical protein GGI15_000678 [Coemansia interrupta]|uniref:3-oxo-5-alpha-steroid 4-dehydrogenase C-terminal domain-containing protein n=1 Tax=Coemansia interrupta TaxID=1126814 RepID=A0A9W8HJX5_9FUNG|nr:hypothetical protein GGI15_000678 [Coemansia interrupta]
MLVQIVRSTYAVLACIALAFELVPWTREAFVKYGKTRAAAQVNGGHIPRTPVAKAVRWFSTQTVPKNLFWHFYALGVAVCMLLMLDLGSWIADPTETRHHRQQTSWVTSDTLGLVRRLAVKCGYSAPVTSPHMTTVLLLLLLGMYGVHVVLRLKEALYDQPATSARMHIGQYGVGIVYYIVTPFAVVVDGIGSPGWISPSIWLVAFGFALYIYASVHQWRCHHILYRLRRRSLRKGSGYAIPSGDLFEYVVCPHFLCEILVYVAIWIVSGFQATTLLWTIGWTAINLGITARETRKWYIETFGTKFPNKRRALVPFVF